MVVEDEPDTASTTARLVDVWGHDVQVAHDSEAAFELVLLWQPGIVLCDIALPKRDGNVLAARIREQDDAEQPVLIAVTGFGDPAHQDRARQAGFDYYLVKPVDPAVLKHLLAKLSRLKSSRLRSRLLRELSSQAFLL